LALTSSTVTTGNLMALTNTGTAAASNTKNVLAIASSGANGTASQTVTGQTISVTNTGTTGTNVGLNVTASGATNNYAALFTGRVGIGTLTPVSQLDIGTGQLTGGTNSATFRNYLDMAGASGFASCDFVFPGGSSVLSKGLFRAGQVSVLGTNDIFFQAAGLTSASYGYFETANGAGSVIGTYADAGSGGPILFRPDRTTRMNLNTAGTFRIGDGTSGAASSLVDMTSTSRGLLLPRMTKTQRDAIASPATGLTIWQTDNTPGLRSYNGTNWMKFTESTD